MAFVSADRVSDTTTVTGTGNVTVSGVAPTGYRTLSAVLSVGDTFYYCISDQTNGKWETGTGTYVSANVFARTTVLSSSNSGSLVAFTDGTKTVFVTFPAAKMLQTTPGTVGASAINVVATGSITARTLGNRAADIVNVKDFGAVGDGVADDTAAIQAAINAAGIAGGGEVYFDRGTYKVTSTLAVAYNNVSFIGANPRGSLLYSTANSSKILSVTGTWFTLRDMSFDYATTPVAGAVAIYLESQNTTLDNFVVFKSYVGIQLGNGTLGSCGATRVSNFQLLTHVDAGIYGYGSLDCFFSNGVINAANGTNAANGNIRLLNANEAFVMNNVDILLGVYSIVTDAASYTAANRTAYSKFTNVYFDSSSQGTYLNNLVLTSFIGCWFSNGRTGAGYFGCALNQSDEVSFLGCEFANCGGGGLNIAASAKRTKVIGCNVESNSYTAGAGVAHGIVIANSCSDFIITNNHCHNGLFPGTQGFGIVLDSNVSNFIVKDNNLLGNAAGSMYVGSVGGGGVIANNLGYAPGMTIPTVTASPYTYTAGPYNETAYITGGTVSIITVGGQGVFSSTDKTIGLGPNETVTIAYSAAPTVRVMRG